jgi:hypothetical protein
MSQLIDLMMDIKPWNQDVIHPWPRISDPMSYVR